MKRNLILMAILVISSLIIVPALAQNLPQTQDQQTQATSPVYVAAADETRPTVVATEEAGSSKKVVVRNKNDKRKKVVIGNKDTKRYYLFGMTGYYKVKKNHRIYFKSEEQAIANGYYKSGSGKDLINSLSSAGERTIKNKNILMADSAATEKSLPEALPKKEKTAETKAPEKPKTVEEPQKLSGENIQKETVKKETITDAQKEINQKLQDLQNQVDTLRDLGRAREKITIGEAEDKSEQEKAVLTAAGREYTMMKKGAIELQYSLQYSYVSSDQVISATSVVPRASHTITNAIDVQYGLRENITTGIHVPFVYAYDKTGGSSAVDVSDLGDISLNLSYQPYKSGGDWPTTTITMGVNLPTGRSPYEIDLTNDLPTGSGFYSVSLGMNMSKAVDPGMLFGSIGCTYSLERDGLSQYQNGYILEDVNPGMSYNAAIGLAYAMTYALSMNVSFQFGYSGSTDYTYSNTDTINTTDAYSTGSLNIGMGYRVTPLTTLSFTLSIGLTRNDPDFSFLFRLPFDF